VIGKYYLKPAVQKEWRRWAHRLVMISWREKWPLKLWAWLTGRVAIVPIIQERSSMRPLEFCSSIAEIKLTTATRKCHRERPAF